MSGQGIFLIRSDGSMLVLDQAPYESEDLLQTALASYPAVLVGGVTGSNENSVLLLVKREMGLPKAQAAGATWSVDHLFVDPNGVPVVVEVKRASDTRIRREVVGQMLDYAANAVKYWPVATLRVALSETAESEGKVGDELIKALRPDLDPEDYWQLVDDNLSAGRIRMVFVADSLPAELVRIIEFLNEQMSPAEVLGVEVPQFLGDGLQLLVPKLVGNTTVAAANKQVAEGMLWTRDSFIAAAEERCSPTEVALLERLLEHVEKYGEKFSWGRGLSPGVSGWYHLGDSARALWTANAGGTTPGSHPYLYLYLPELKKRLGVDEFESFVAQLSSIAPLKSKIVDAGHGDYEKGYPSVFLGDLAKAPGASDAFFAALDALMSQEPSS